MQSPFSILSRVLEGHDLLFSNAVAATGILVKRSTGALPATVALTSIAIGNPAVVTSTAPHGLVNGDPVTIAGITGFVAVPAGATPNGTWRVTVISTTTFSIPINLTTGGTGGTVQPPPPVETIGELTSVTPPGFGRDKIPVSTHNEGTESNVLGILTQDDAAFEVNYVGSDLTHQHLYSDMVTTPPPKNTWIIAMPSSSALSFMADARVSSFKIGAATVNSAQKASLALVWASPIKQYVGTPS